MDRDQLDHDQAEARRKLLEQAVTGPEPAVGGTLLAMNVVHFAGGRFEAQFFANGLATSLGPNSGKALAAIMRHQADALDPPGPRIIPATEMPNGHLEGLN